MECTNCSSFLDEKNIFYLPKCGHIVCETCLDTKSQHQSELTCSSCNSKFQTDHLAKSLLVSSMMEDKLTVDTCIVCKESHPVTKYCFDCDQAFCDEMESFHQQFLLFRKHVVVTIEEFYQYQNSRRHLGFLHHKSCIRHHRPFEFLDLETKTHNRLLCSECLVGKHVPTGLGDCSFSLLHQKLERIRELGSQGTAHLAELCEEEENLSHRLKELEQSRERSLSDIRRVFGSLHELLQTRQEELEREVEELSKSAEFKLSEERERSRVWQGQLSLLGKCVEEINSNPIPPSSHDNPFDSSADSSPPDALNLGQRALMVDACLLEDALRYSLSSSRASSSLTDLQSQLNLTKIRDQIEFSFTFVPRLSGKTSLSLSTPSNIQPVEREEETLLHRISTMFSVTSTSNCPPFQFNWSKNKVQSEMTFFSKRIEPTKFSSPWGLAYSPDSKLFYVCDCSNNRIQVFRNHPQAEREGRVEIEYLPPFGFSSPSNRYLNPPYIIPPLLSTPTGICYHDGELFISDHDNNRVQVWREEDGSFLWMIGTGSAGKAVGQFYLPRDCTVYQNHLFVSEYGNCRIQKFSLSDFSVVKVIGSQGSGLGQLQNPRGLSVFNDKLYVADSGNNRISVFDPESGAALSMIGPSLLKDGELELSSPRGILFSHNLLFVSSEHRISVFDSDHNYLYSFGSKGSGNGQFSTPDGMVMVDGKLFVSDQGNGRLHVFEQRLDRLN